MFTGKQIKKMFGITLATALSGDASRQYNYVRLLRDARRTTHVVSC